MRTRVEISRPSLARRPPTKEVNVETISSTPEPQASEAPVVPMWLDTKQAEVYTGLSHVTLWRARKQKSIKAAQIGRAVRYSRESLDAYMERCSENA
jgi:excisionase family DNA binding protein